MACRAWTPAQRFVLRFFVLLWFLSVALWVTALHQSLGPLQATIASAAVQIARVAGSQASASNDLIRAGTLLIEINHECTGVFVLFIFAAFVLAYPARPRWRLVGLIAGVALLSLVNVVRLAMLVRLAELWPSSFEYFHEYVWQGIFLGMTVFAALYWARSSD